MYLPADQQIRSLPTRTRIQPSASSCPVPRVVESRFKKWLKQQGGAAAGKQAVGAAAAEDDVESGSEDDAPQPEGKASASNDTKKIAGHFPGWPVGSRWVAPPFSAEVHAAVPPERSAPRLVPPACHSTRKPNNCRASASTSLPAPPSARPPAHQPPACLPTFLPAATTPAGPTPAPSWPAWASTSPRLLASTLCRPARPAEMPPRCVPSQHRPLHGPCVLLDLVLVGHICLPSPGESMRLARTLRAPGRGHHDSLPCRACHALGRPAQTQPSPALPVGRSLQPR